MDDLKLVFNCTMPLDFILANETVIPIYTVKTSPLTAVKAVGISALTSITIVLLINLVFYCHHANSTALADFLNNRIVKKTISLFILLLSLPLVTVFLVLALCYKVLCSVIIRRRDKNFVGFLDSFDVFWSLEDEATINVLGVIESESPEALVDSIRNKLQNITTKAGLDKIFYRRNEEYGFYYWRRSSLIDINEYVEIIEFSDKYTLNDMDLEDIMSEVSYQLLPYNNEGLFKIFVTKQRVGHYYEERGEYGIIFVIHHSIGDGVALLEFLCKTLGDEAHKPLSMFPVPEAKNYDTATSLLEMIRKLWEIPLCFADTILRKADDNDLHGPSLLGEKSFKWTESDENLLQMVKEIKENVDNVAFTDVLATALSGGVHDYFTKTKAHVPEDLGIVLPVRFPKSSSASKDPRLLLKNDFSVTILDLPMRENRTLQEIKRRCNKLRKSVDPLSNHYFIKLVTVLPKQILQRILNSSQATMVFSNMPGPSALTICGGNELKKLVFFVPHKGNTGLDVTALCYGGVLRLAASADKALISNPDHLSYILDGMVDEIKRLHNLHVKN